MEPETMTMVVSWRDVAVYALAFAGSGVVLFLTVAVGLAKWVIARVLAGQAETNARIDKMEEHVNSRLLQLDRRVTRIEAKSGIPTPMPNIDDNLLG